MDRPGGGGGAGELARRVALVTGAGSGIGRATALTLAAHGATVIAADVAGEAAEETARQVRARGGAASAAAVDVRDDAAVASAVAALMADRGRLDVAVNAAGVGGVQERTADYPEEAWQLVIDVNLTGVWRCMRHEIPAMLRGGGGTIVNVASVAGVVGYPRHAAYSASKHGVIGLTRTAALEYGKRGVRVNAVCPGFTLTPMVERIIDAGLPAEELAARVPLGRLGTPEEIAEAIRYLCSDAAAFMVGHALLIDGGMTAA